MCDETCSLPYAGLHVLIARNNQISEIPKEIAKLPLKVIFFLGWRACCMTRQCLSGRFFVKVVDVSNNNIDDVPGEMGKMQSLNTLILDGTRI